ncbi:MAG TPA: winged helix DNA-binding domain-containing protein [Chloroflexota bacterium]|nr:winged helix DNA-binding domain-containing protein [Chloroflexota bacterium]
MTARATSRSSPAASVTWQQVMAYRLRQHHLHRRVPRADMLPVVARLGGVQAQLMSSAELALWARVDDLAPNAVSHALWEERSLVKTWAMRGTLHLLPAPELPLWQSVPALDRRYHRPAWLRYFGLTAEDLEQVTEAVAGVLRGRLLTREELVGEVARVVGSEDLAAKLRHGWGTMLKPAAFRCQLCFAPNLGRNVRFTRPDSWLGGVRPVETAEAEREVTRRYLAAHGPATREAYALWLGVPASRAGALIRGLGEEVVPVDVSGTSAWAPAGEVDRLQDAGAHHSVRLLPAFDQYVITASRVAPHFLPGPFKDRIYRPQGWLSPVLLVAGRMDGVWRHEVKGNRLLVRIEPFVDIPAWARQAAEEEAERLAAFFARSLELTWQRESG